MELTVSISELLKTNDCVIIPDLGGFIVNDHASRYDATRDQFSPPSREIIFSSKLTKNDGLLVNYLSEQNGTGYLEARKIVAEWVAEIIFKLEHGESLFFEQVGTLRFDANGVILFEPVAGQFLSRESFGLDSFHFPTLQNKYQPPVAKPVFKDKEPEPNKRVHPAVKYIAVALPLIAILYLLPVGKLLNKSGRQATPEQASLVPTDTPPPIGNEVAKAKEQASETIDSTLKIKPVEQAPVVTASADKQESASVVSTQPQVVQQKPVEQEKPLNQTVVNLPGQEKFHIIGGCFKLKANAEKMAQRLVKQGYPATVADYGKGLFRVSVKSFATRKEAEAELGRLFQAEPDKDYWLMADKN